jgi:hypothetical protein
MSPDSVKYVTEQQFTVPILWLNNSSLSDLDNATFLALYDCQTRRAADIPDTLRIDCAQWDTLMYPVDSNVFKVICPR